MQIRKTARFKSDFRRMAKRGQNISALENVLEILTSGQPLPAFYHDHILHSGDMKGVHDAHLAPDWVLLYEIQGETLVLYRTGTHSDLNL